MELKFRTLNADEIDVRVAQIKSNGCAVLLYKNARVDMDLLDETVGAMRWKRTHSRENANCTVSIYNDELHEWISKEDVGTESNTEAQKGLASDSFKRACVNWGIGRELYTAPFIWIGVNGVNIDGKDGKYRTNDRFSVREIEYDAQRRISKLVIWNEKKRKVVFDWVSGKAPVFEDDDIGIPAQKPPADYKPEPTQPATMTVYKASDLICAECGKPITPYIKDGSVVYTAEQIANMNLKRYRTRLCSKCSFKRKEAKGA